MGARSGLIKEKLTAEEKSWLFEQYKTFIHSAEKISERRDKANTFFWAIEAGLITLLDHFEGGVFAIIIAIFGVLFSYYWFCIVKSYKQLNTGKYKVIHELEEKLPARLYEYEWKILGEGKDKKKYWPTTHIENIVTAIFILFWIIVSIFLAGSKIKSDLVIDINIRPICHHRSCAL